MGKKVHRIVLEVLDLDEVGIADIKAILENGNYPGDCISTRVREMQTRDIGEWDDDHPLNNAEEAHRFFFAIFGEEAPRLKRDNWTNEEVVGILEGRKLTDRSEDRAGHDDGVEDCIDVFREFSIPEEEMGAMAYDTATKFLVHVGTVPPEAVIRARPRGERDSGEH